FVEHHKPVSRDAIIRTEIAADNDLPVAQLFGKVGAAAIERFGHKRFVERAVFVQYRYAVGRLSVVLPEITGNDVFPCRSVIKEFGDGLVGSRSAGIEGSVDRTIGIQAKYPAGRHAIKLVETTINHKFAVVCTTIVNNGVNVAIATGAEAVGSLVKPEGRIQCTVGMQPGQVPYFHAVHND